MVAEADNPDRWRLQEAPVEGDIIMSRMRGVPEQLVRVLPEAQVLIMGVINLVLEGEADKARQARLQYLARLEKAEMVLHL